MRFRASVLVTLLLVLLSGARSQTLSTLNELTVTQAICSLSGTNGADEVTGTVTFELVDAALTANYSVSGLEAGDYVLSLNSYGQIVDVEGLATFPRVLDIDNFTYADAPVDGTVTVEGAALSGVTSVVGRSVAVLDSSDFSVAAQCVIGRSVTANTTAEPNRVVSQASSLVRGLTDPDDFFGLFNFEATETGVKIRAFVVNAEPNTEYYFEVHENGDLVNGPGPVFVSYINDTAVSDSTGTISTYLFSSMIALNGNLSVVGRSVVLHESETNSAVALGVIGTTVFEPLVIEEGAESPIITAAANNLQSTPLTDLEVTGYITYDLIDVENGIIRCTYFISGLEPSASHGWHVHIFGDLMGVNAVQLAVKGHFIGNPGDARAEVGQINDNTPILSDDAGIARGQFDDNIIAFNGENSIIGRSLIIHDPNTPSIRIAVGVIGRVSEVFDVEVTDEDDVDSAELTPAVSQAMCRLVETGNSDEAVDGFVSFETIPDSDNILVRYVIVGLTEGPHPWHVHLYGDIVDTDNALATSGHFIGDAITRDEIGQLNGNEPIFANEAGVSSGQFIDTEIRLAGNHSIVGRSVVIHTGSPRFAQCVIGISREGELIDFRDGPSGNTPQVVKAASLMIAGEGIEDNAFTGYMEFYRDSEGALSQFTEEEGIVVRFVLSGLSPGFHNWHIHDFGDEFNLLGEEFGPHFVGTDPIRPDDFPQEVGLLNDGEPIFADENGIAVGVLVDTQIELNGPNSIVGRGIVVHGNGDDSVVYAGLGAVGRVLEEENTGADHAEVTRAACVLVETDDNPAVNGWIVFEDAGDDGVLCYFQIAGLSPGDHPWHVHSYGDLIRSDGFSVGGHFIGTNPDRPEGTPQEIGSLDDNIPIFADADGFARDYFFDNQIALNGENSIVGRGMIIHNGANRTSQCVIGQIRFAGSTEETMEASTRREVQSAVCNLEPTVNNADDELTGQFLFTDDGSGTLTGSYSITGLSDRDHGYHVHEFGNLFGIDGQSVAGHYIGEGAVRPGDLLNEVGYLNDGAPLVSVNGVATGTLTDQFATLNGDNSIIGRGMIIHGNDGDSGARVAQCIIGVDEAEDAGDNRATVVDNPVTRAMCIIEETDNNDGPVSGFVEFETRAFPDEVHVRFMVSGLSPGMHTWHVHVAGDISSDDGSAVLGHYIGDCDPCRPDDILQEVGQIDDGLPVFADADGFSRDSFTDTEIQLYGPNSIVGRSIIFHGNDDDAGVRVAQCVIGLTETVAAVDVPVIDENDGGLSGGAVAGIVIGTLFGVGAVVFGGVMMMKKKKGSHTFDMKKVELIDKQSTDGEAEPQAEATAV